MFTQLSISKNSNDSISGKKENASNPTEYPALITLFAASIVISRYKCLFQRGLILNPNAIISDA